MWLVVGLGNPGSKYALNRHNIGFMVVDAFLRELGNPPISTEQKAQIAKTKIDSESVLFCKPQTFMNLSGESVQGLMNFYKISRDHLIVIHDEIDQPFAQIKIQKNRGHGGHNGVRSITDLTGSPDYYRIRLGVGRPTIPQMNVADWVLQNFSDEEMDKMPEFLGRSMESIEALIFDGLNKAATQFNK